MARKSKDITSFGSGFMAGVLAGVFGYLVFGTHQGDDFRENVKEKLEEARQLLYEEGVIDDPDMPLPEVVAAIRQQAESLFEAASKGKTPSASAKKKKFSGV